MGKKKERALEETVEGLRESVRWAREERDAALRDVAPLQGRYRQLVSALYDLGYDVVIYGPATHVFRRARGVEHVAAAWGARRSDATVAEPRYWGARRSSDPVRQENDAPSTRGEG